MATVVAYAQERPTEAAAIERLEELFGGADAIAIWESARERAEISPPVEDLPSLLSVAKRLTDSDVPLARVVGRSMVIRIISYNALTERGKL